VTGVRLERWRFSQHRGLYAWVIIVFSVAMLFAIAAARHAGWNGPAFPNRAGPESNSAGSEAQGAGEGDVGKLNDHPAR
jgi:hypothetical protein